MEIESQYICDNQVTSDIRACADHRSLVPFTAAVEMERING